MKLVRRQLGFFSVLTATLMVLMTVPFQGIFAAMIPTEAASSAQEARDARERLKVLVARQDVQDALRSHGVDPSEARARMDGLTDAEAVSAAQKIDELAPGGSAIGVIVGALLIVFLVLLVTDIMGYTDIFPFVKPKK